MLSAIFGPKREEGTGGEVQALTAVTMMRITFWNVTSFSLVQVAQDRRAHQINNQKESGRNQNNLLAAIFLLVLFTFVLRHLRPRQFRRNVGEFLQDYTASHLRRDLRSKWGMGKITRRGRFIIRTLHQIFSGR